MNSFDKQRIENAIWILEQYSYEITQIAKNLEWHTWDCESLFDVLGEVKKQLRAE